MSVSTWTKPCAQFDRVRHLGVERLRGLPADFPAESLDKPLPLKGYKMDQGSRPSHKGEVIRWFERGLQPPDIAHETNHNLKSVERYLRL